MKVLKVPKKLPSPVKSVIGEERVQEETSKEKPDSDSNSNQESKQELEDLFNNPLDNQSLKKKVFLPKLDVERKKITGFSEDKKEIEKSIKRENKETKKVEIKKDLENKELLFEFLAKNIDNADNNDLLMDLMERNVIEALQEFHTNGFKTKEFLRGKIDEIISDLRELEEEWVLKNKEIELLREDIEDIETKINEKTLELKKVLMLLKSISLKLDKNKWFYTRDGRVFKSLKDLLNGLKDMDDETYSFHTRHHGNDFSSWIKDVFGLVDLARDIEGKDRLDVINILKNFIDI